VTLHDDVSHGMVRTEVRCAHAAATSAMSSGRAGPEGLRFCINSAALDFDGAGSEFGQVSRR
jgi:peptide-methionine (R)-S-oxide reductase